MNRMWAITEREMRKFFRSPVLMVMSMMLPLVQLVILGNAFGGKIHGARVAVVDHDHSSQSVRVKEAFDAVGANINTFQAITYADETQAKEDVRTGKIDAAVIIPSQFSRRVYAKDAPASALVGNLKLAAAPLPVDEGELARLRGVVGDRPVWLAASIHPGEDAGMLAVHARLARDFPDVLTILAPRHPERHQPKASPPSIIRCCSKPCCGSKPMPAANCCRAMAPSRSETTARKTRCRRDWRRRSKRISTTI